MRTQEVPTELEYRFGYQGNFAEKDDETGWNHFELREFDPIIGRWLVPDPKRQYWISCYVAMGNNPINLVDPGWRWRLRSEEGAISKDGRHQMFSKGQWTQLLKEVTITDSKSNFTSFAPQPVPQDATRYVIQNSYSYPVFEDKGYGWAIQGGSGKSYGPGQNVGGKKTIIENYVDLRMFFVYSKAQQKRSGVSDETINEVMKDQYDAVHNVPTQETYDTLYKGNVYNAFGYSSISSWRRLF